MRKENPVLSSGKLEFTIADDQKMVLAYRRYDKNSGIIAIFNRSGDNQVVSVPELAKANYKNIFSTGDILTSGSEVKMGPISAVVLKKE
jgi:glycosidase